MARKPGSGKLSEADAALFDAAMKDVAPLEPRKRKAAKAKPAAKPVERPKPAPPAAPPPAVKPAKTPLVAGTSADTDARTMLRLKRGRIRPEGRLDLHGMTQDAAWRALTGFVAHAQREARRCVIVVTGTGRYREGAGVLRAQVPKWLSVPPLRDHVIGFATAQPADGGDGALYVLLRRKRAERRR